MSLVPSSSAIETGGYTLSRSLRFRSSASAYLNRTFGSTGNQQTWTWSGWVKEAALVKLVFLQQYTDGNNQSQVAIGNSSTIRFYDLVSGSFVCDVTWSMVFRDPSAWYHIVIAVDTTQATNTNRIKLYVNGTQQTNTSSASWPSQNANLRFNANTPHFIGQNGAGNDYWDGYLAEVNFIGGQALTPSSFGQTDATTGVWVPKKYGGTYGTNGFYLPFTNTTSATTLCYDSSGNGNNWTPNNISTTAGATYDSMTDVPTLTSATAGNYCTLNPLDKYSSLSMTNGNLTITNDGGSGNWWTTRSTIWISSGKWYWESTIGGSQYSVVGVAGLNQPVFTNDRWVGYTSDSYGYYGANGNKVNNNSSTGYGSSYTAGDVIGVALDMDAGTLVFYKNGVSQGTAFTGLSGLVSPGFSVNDQGTNPYQDVNFGQRPFTYTTAGSNRPASTFLALNTFNLSAPTIPAGNKYMDATLYTGNGSTQTITNAAGFQPGLVWNKSRSVAASHELYDSVRGATNRICSNLTQAEDIISGVTSFNANGYSLGSGTGSNSNGNTFVGWQWKAGATSSSNTSGSITSTVSVNATAGFSVVTYTGTGASATVGHGLGVAPKFIIVKDRSGVNPWPTYHASLGIQYYTLLNAADASYNNLANYWGSSNPTSTTFGLGPGYGGNDTSGHNYVAYCWAEIAGFSKFGSYTGNGDANGVFVYLGFRPKYIMFKRTDTGGFGWEILDTSRNPYNVSSNALYANLSDAEGSTSPYSLVDILSNGFKHRTDGYLNQSGTYIYAAFAESPFKYSNAR